MNMRWRFLIFAIVFLPAVSMGQVESLSPVPQGDTLAVISFSDGSSSLNADARRLIDGLSSELKKLDHDRKLIRIEGFSLTRKGEHFDWTLSAKRAQAVVEYIRSKYQVQIPPFITAHVASRVSSPGDRVEIILYDNLFKIRGAVVPIHMAR